LLVVAVRELEVELVDRELEDFGVDTGVVAVTDVEADADLLGNVGDDVF